MPRKHPPQETADGQQAARYWADVIKLAGIRAKTAIMLRRTAFGLQLREAAAKGAGHGAGLCKVLSQWSAIARAGLKSLRNSCIHVTMSGLFTKAAPSACKGMQCWAAASDA